MTPESTGIALSIAGALVALVGTTFALRAALRLRGTQRRIEASRAFDAINWLQAEGTRIGVSIAPLASLQERIDRIAVAGAAAAESGAKFGADIALIAKTTEDLLDVLVPSLRGSAS